MIIYEVNLQIHNQIYNEYYFWLLQHIPIMLQFPGFQKAEIGVVEQENENDYQLLRINYTVESDDHLKSYLVNHAAQMREEGIQKFGEKFSASRRIIHPAQHFS